MSIIELFQTVYFVKLNTLNDLKGYQGNYCNHFGLRLYVCKHVHLV